MKSFPSPGDAEALRMSPDVLQDKAGTARLAFPRESQPRVMALPGRKEPHFYRCYSQLMSPVPDPAVRAGSFPFHRNNGLKTSASRLCTLHGYGGPPCRQTVTGDGGRLGS